ncbi:hypothetical protein [Allomuricauda sp. SCSIO 65647]|uniref:hypothetical protein n=1 Tax=Allomuricauda sp. SCSIO 65647 TaxID=2908843 RepID=UPI001F23406C|nr:hypothetical protein [Muricauda sp. SCSIO 65647]UJH68420.1 hypothetical protein L0P89_04235 [Muricauda sp. SCSIO 65647]
MKRTVNFEELRHLKLETEATKSFDALIHCMENRFTGLPLFHKSIHLKVLKFEKIIENEVEIPSWQPSVFASAAPHLKKDLFELLNHARNKKGRKSLGLLFLRAKVFPHLLNQELQKRAKSISRTGQLLCRWIGPHIDAPVILAVLSIKTHNRYESLAVGLKGVSTYRSALYLRPLKGGTHYEIEAGLDVEVLPKHLAHRMGPFLDATQSWLLPDDFFDGYLKNYLIPEKEDIVNKLCQYVFNKDLHHETRPAHFRATVSNEWKPVFNRINK